MRTRERTAWPDRVPLRPHAPPPAAVAPGHAAITFIGHSTFLIRTASTVMITDPVFTTHAGPFGRMGPRRVRPPALAPASLLKVDFVLLSHNHYDHLQPSSLALFPDAEVITTLGVGQYLNVSGRDTGGSLRSGSGRDKGASLRSVSGREGEGSLRSVSGRDRGESLRSRSGRDGEASLRSVPGSETGTSLRSVPGRDAGRPDTPRVVSAFRRKISELDWWESTQVGAVAVTAVPAQHFSARTPWDRNKSLWCGFVVRLDGVTLYFAGDSGYSPQFAEIGARCPGIDVALIPIGAYEPRWFMTPAHMNPDEAVRAHKDVRARVSIGMHFGTFQLTDEGIDEPLRALERARVEHGVDPAAFGTLDFGETRVFSQETRR